MQVRPKALWGWGTQFGDSNVSRQCDASKIAVRDQAGHAEAYPGDFGLA